MRVYIADWGPLCESGEVLGVYEEEGHAEYAATAQLSENDMEEVSRAPVQGHHTWVDKHNWARVTGYEVE